MALPGFDKAKDWPTEQLLALLIDRVRAERRRLKYSQREFASRCEIPLRTYKRFELGQCDSLAAFIKVVVAFERVTALELLFIPKAATFAPRTPVAVLDRIRMRAQK